MVGLRGSLWAVGLNERAALVLIMWSVFDEM